MIVEPDGVAERGDACGRAGVLSDDEQMLLATLAREGQCPEARRRLIEGSVRLVVSVAHRYTGRGLPLEDLVSEGTIGLIYAIDRFDPTRGVKFSTFAARNIQHAIQRAIGESVGIVRLPPKARRLVARWVRATDRFRVVHGRAAEPGVIAGELGVPARLVLDIEHARAAQQGGRSDATEGAERGAAGTGGDGDVPRDDVLPRLSEAIEALGPVRGAVVRLHFGLSGARQMTLARVARELGISQGRARFELAEAMAALRRAMAAGPARGLDPKEHNGAEYPHDGRVADGRGAAGPHPR